MLNNVEIRHLHSGHLPVVRGCLDRLGIQDVLDRHLPAHPQSQASDAECTVAMVLNILSGRVALWQMDDHLAGMDVELLLGEGVEASWFHDTRLGKALDRIDAAGTDTLLSEIVLGYLTSSEPAPYSVHLDTTSFVLYGAYLDAEEPVPLHGYSKDRRPDLKQLVFGMSVHSGLGFPLTATMCSGNTSDHTANRAHIAQLASLLPERDEVTIVADCKLVDATTLGQLVTSGFHFVSLVPDAQNLRGNLICKAWDKFENIEDWPILATKPGKRKASPRLHYRGMSFPAYVGMRIGDTDDKQLSAELMRGLVVYSDQLAARFDESLAKKLKHEKDKLEAAMKKLPKTFACDADARAALVPLTKKLKFHIAELSAIPEDVVEKRTARGRPRKDAPPPPTTTVWTPNVVLQVDDEAIAAARRKASCFVLITDWPEDRWSDQKVLGEYRHQALIEGHTGFRWLKGPAAVAPLFLKSSRRIRALGFVFMLALMVRNYIQFTLRREMKKRGRGVRHPFSKKIDDNLTTEVAMVLFDKQISGFAKLPGEAWRRVPPKLPEPAKDVLQLLGLDESVYAKPPPRRKRMEDAR